MTASMLHNENENWGCKQWGYLTVHSRDQTDFFQKWLIRRLTQWYKHTVGKKIIKRTKSTNGKNCPRGVGSGQEMCFVICSSVPLYFLTFFFTIRVNYSDKSNVFKFKNSNVIHLIWAITDKSLEFKYTTNSYNIIRKRW